MFALTSCVEQEAELLAVLGEVADAGAWRPPPGS